MTYVRKEQHRAIALIKMSENITNGKSLNELELVHVQMKTLMVFSSVNDNIKQQGKCFMSRIVISWFYYSVKIKYEKTNLNWILNRNILLQMFITVIHVFLFKVFIYKHLKCTALYSSSRATYSGSKMNQDCSIYGEIECKNKGGYQQCSHCNQETSELQTFLASRYLNVVSYLLFIPHWYEIKLVVQFNLDNCGKIFFKPLNHIIVNP